MPDTPTPRPPERAMVPVGPPPPLSVRYAQRLLWLQAGCWALGAEIGGMIGAAAHPPTGILHGRHWAVVILAVGWSAFAIGMATAKMLLADRLGRGRSQRTRKAVIAVELAMTGFGVLWFSTPYSGPGADLAGFAGACLSLAAALVLMRRRARQYAESDPVQAQVTDPGTVAGPASFWRQPALAGA